MSWQSIEESQLDSISQLVFVKVSQDMVEKNPKYMLDLGVK